MHCPDQIQEIAIIKPIKMCYLRTISDYYKKLYQAETVVNASLMAMQYKPNRGDTLLLDIKFDRLRGLTSHAKFAPKSR